ncbi:MAG TPA: hypothetical protein VLC30_12770, partial [Pseudomonas sp.]|nr:hypothetical protein [Pseudomonas sp.]
TRWIATRWTATRWIDEARSTLRTAETPGGQGLTVFCRSQLAGDAVDERIASKLAPTGASGTRLRHFMGSGGRQQVNCAPVPPFAVCLP